MHRFTLFFGLCLIATLLSPLLACSDDEPAPSSEPMDDAQPAQVEVATIDTHSIDDDRRWSATLKPLQSIPLEAPIDGTLSELTVRQGDSFSRGDILARIVDPSSSARRDVLQRRRDHLEDEYQRWLQLADADAAGPSETTEAHLRLLEVEELLADVEAALGQQTLRAPADGRVTTLHARQHTQLNQGQPIATLETDDAFAVHLSIPTADTHYLADLDALDLVDDQGRSLSVDRITFADDDHPHFSAAYLHIADLDDPRRRQVHITYRDHQDVALIPWTAVFTDDEEPRASLVTGDPPTVEYRSLELGRAHTRGIEIVDGLQPGDQVLRYQPRSHADGSTVDPLETDR